MLWQGNAVMGPDGKLLETDSSGQIIVPKVVKSKSSDDEDQVLKCDICKYFLNMIKIFLIFLIYNTLVIYIQKVYFYFTNYFILSFSSVLYIT